MRNTIPLIFLASCTEGVGDYFFKKYAMKEDMKDLAMGSVTYGVMIYLLIQVWKKDSLSCSNSIWNSFSLIIDGWVGTVLFNEKLTDKEKYSMMLSLAGSSLGAFETAHL